MWRDRITGRKGHILVEVPSRKPFQINSPPTNQLLRVTISTASGNPYGHRRSIQKTLKIQRKAFHKLERLLKQPKTHGSLTNDT